MKEIEILCNIKENYWCKLDKTAKTLITEPLLDPQFFFFVSFTSTSQILYRAIILYNLKEN